MQGFMGRNPKWRMKDDFAARFVVEEKTFIKILMGLCGNNCLLKDQPRHIQVKAKWKCKLT